MLQLSDVLGVRRLGILGGVEQNRPAYSLACSRPFTIQQEGYGYCENCEGWKDWGDGENRDRNGGKKRRIRGGAVELWGFLRTHVILCELMQ